MAFHVADGLEGFGPSRGWWSFSMERLMGQVLKATRNNQPGELLQLNLVHFIDVLLTLIIQRRKNGNNVSQKLLPSGKPQGAPPKPKLSASIGTSCLSSEVAVQSNALFDQAYHQLYQLTQYTPI